MDAITPHYQYYIQIIIHSIVYYIYVNIVWFVNLYDRMSYCFHIHSDNSSLESLNAFIIGIGYNDVQPVVEVTIENDSERSFYCASTMMDESDTMPLPMKVVLTVTKKYKQSNKYDESELEVNEY